MISGRERESRLEMLDGCSSSCLLDIYVYNGEGGLGWSIVGMRYEIKVMTALRKVPFLSYPEELNEISLNQQVDMCPI